MRGDEHFALVFSTEDFSALSTRVIERKRHVFRMIDNSMTIISEMKLRRQFRRHLLFPLIEKKTSLIVRLIDRH